MYVDAWYNRKRDRMYVAERVDGQRVLREEMVDHVLYYAHPAGGHQTIFGEPCKKFSTTSFKKFEDKKKELAFDKKAPKLFESDIRPEFRFLAKHYMGADTPVLNVGFFDIEVDFDPDRGFAPTHDPFNSVTAITIHLSHLDRVITLALKPKALTLEEARKMVEPVYEDGILVSGFENTIVFDDEKDVLLSFLDLIEDVDVLSGWNSEGYDIPYLVNRIKLKIGDDATRRMCLWGLLPREREYVSKFGEHLKTYDLVGRVHLDYLVLYQKHNTQQQHSYRLDFIAELEVGDNKTVYEGTLDNLYNKDFYRFIDYNRQDVVLLIKIDKKKRFIELANQIAHSNCVLLKTTVGSVSLVEQAIINEMNSMGFVVPNRKTKEELQKKADDKAARDVVKKPQRLDKRKYSDLLQDYLLSLPQEEIDEFNVYVEAQDDESLRTDIPKYMNAFERYTSEREPDVLNRIISMALFEEEEPEEIGPVDESGVKLSKDGRTPVVGAYVAHPKKGLHKEVACIDINSLYPSCIRSLNMSPETIVGQVRPTTTMALIHERIESGTPRAEAWDGIFYLIEIGWMYNETEDRLIVDFEDGREMEMTGAELYRMIFTPENELCISANGTIFSTKTEGIIPHLLAKWYSDRKAMQKKEREFSDLMHGIDVVEKWGVDMGFLDELK